MGGKSSGQKEAVQGLLDLFVKKLLDRHGQNVISIVLFGSVARGTIHPTSDIDLLIVMDKADDRLLLDVEDADVMAARLRTYEKWGLSITFSPYVLSREEANRHRPVYLDIVHEGRIILDRDGFISGVFAEVRRRMKELGTKRMTLPDGSWYWILKPDLIFGEEVEV